MILLAPGSGGGGGGGGGRRRSRRDGPRVVDGGAAAVLELAPREAFWKKDYEILAHVLGLRFHRLYGNLSHCLPRPTLAVRWQQRLAEFNRWLTCNLTVDAGRAADWARAMEEGCVSKCSKS